MREIFSVFNSDRPYEASAHTHEEYMFMVSEHGVLRFTDEENDWSTTLVERQFLMVPPGWGHSTASLTGEQSHFVFYVDPDHMHRALCDLSGDASRMLQPPTLGVWEGSAPLRHLLLVEKALREPTAVVDRTCQLTQTDYLLLLECVATSLSKPSVRRSSTQRHGAALVRDVRAYLAGNLEHAPTLDELAHTFKVSRRHLTRLFSEETGSSILAYTQHLRMARAKDLLRHTHMSVLEIAHAVGFQSPSHFAEIFLREVAMGPDDWRRQAANATQ